MPHDGVRKQLRFQWCKGHDEQFDNLPLHVDANVQQRSQRVADVPILEVTLIALYLIIKDDAEHFQDNDKDDEAEKMGGHGSEVSRFQAFHPVAHHHDKYEYPENYTVDEDGGDIPHQCRGRDMCGHAVL